MAFADEIGPDRSALGEVEMSISALQQSWSRILAILKASMPNF
jgi:hypothetical protein